MHVKCVCMRVCEPERVSLFMPEFDSNIDLNKCAYFLLFSMYSFLYLYVFYTQTLTQHATEYVYASSIWLFTLSRFSFALFIFHMRMCVAAAAAAVEAAAATMAVVVVALNSYRAIFINPWRSKREKGLLIEYTIVWKKKKQKFCLSCVELFHIAPLCLPHKQDSSYGATPRRMEWMSEWVS